MRNRISRFMAIALTAAILLGYARVAEAAEIEDFDQYVTEIDELTLREGTRIVALGEATHGNREFQQLKRELFEVLAEKHNIHALVLEGDFGGCSIVNDYIQGGPGDDRELTKLLGYRLYRTDDMQELIRWMHDYNETAPDEQKVRLYGMDIQSCTDSIRVIKNFYEQADEEKAPEVSRSLDDLFGLEEDAYDRKRTDEIIAYTVALSEDLSDNAEVYEEAIGKDQYFRACLAAEALNRYITYREKEKLSNKYRDGSMKVLVDRILEFEEKEHSSELMMACHNGHMTKNKSSSATFLGKDLYKEYGTAYFAIGTDFYYTACNLPGKDGRMVKEFCSDDPLALCMKDSSLEKGLLVFSEVEEESDLYPYITEKIPTGSLGEAYSPMMAVMKSTYQINFPPVDMYDAMILYYQTNPTEIWEKE